MTYNFEDVGKKIRELRKAKKLTQSYIAEACGFAQYQTVANWENGNVRPSLDVLLKLCDIFDCQLGYLLGDYPSNTWQQSNICNETKLSPEAVKTLVNLSPVQIAFLNDLLSSPDEFELISKKYESYLYMLTIVEPYVQAHKAELEPLKITSDFSINGEKLLPVPVQDAPFYSRIEFQRALTNFADKIAEKIINEHLQKENK